MNAKKAKKLRRLAREANQITAKGALDPVKYDRKETLKKAIVLTPKGEKEEVTLKKVTRKLSPYCERKIYQNLKKGQ